MNDSENGLTYAIFDTAANRKLIGDLKKSGAPVRLFPPLTAIKNELDETQNAYFKRLVQFDWLIFADVFAVDYFIEMLEENAADIYDLDALRVCAFGETVSDRLRFAAVHADVIPSKVFAPEIFAELVNYIGASAIGGLKFLFLTNETLNDDLTANLREANAEVIELQLYRVKPEENSELIKLKTLLKGGAIDEFVLTAPEDLSALRYYFKSENLADVFAGISVAASDAVMLQAAKEYDLRRVGLFRRAKVDKVI